MGSSVYDKNILTLGTMGLLRYVKTSIRLTDGQTGLKTLQPRNSVGVW